MTIVIDTSVLVDIFLDSRPRHFQAKKLGLHIVDARIKVMLPLHALFELSCALRNENLTNPLQISKEFDESNPFPFEVISMDQSFFSKYFDPSLPYLKAGDLIFIALAKGENAILITEDDKQYKAAKEASISVYRIDEFLTDLDKI